MTKWLWKKTGLPNFYRGVYGNDTHHFKTAFILKNKNNKFVGIIKHKKYGMDYTELKTKVFNTPVEADKFLRKKLKIK